ncbi:hypothetical protein TNCV_2798371, partial [Trichonephila clavipes]
MQGKAILRVRMAERSKALRLDPIPLLWAWDGQAVKGAAFMSKSTRTSTYVRENSFTCQDGRSSKALRLDHIPLLWAWHVSGWPSGHKALRSYGSPPGFGVGSNPTSDNSFFEVKNYMQVKAILRVRMAERSKALRSGRSPLLWAWSFFEVKNYMQGKAILRVRMAERSKRCDQVAVHFCGRGMAKRSKALRSCRSPPGFGVGSNPTSDKSFFEVKNYMQGKAILRVRMAERSKALRSGRSPLLWAWDGQAVKGAAFMSKSARFWRGHFLRLKTTCKGKAILLVRMAERSKALRSGRSPLVWAWSFFEVKNYMQGKAILRVRMAERSNVLQSGPSPLAWSFFEVKNYMQGKAILRVRMAERSKALRSGRSPLVWAWVPNTKCKETLSHVRMDDRCKALRLDHIPLLWAWSFFEVKNYMQGKAILRVRMAERSKALRSGRSPLVWAWSFFEVKNYMQGKAILRVRMAERSKALRSGRSPLVWAWSFFEVKNYMQGKAILRVRMAERSKALQSGRSPLLWAWVSNTKCKETLSHVRRDDRCKALRLDHIPLLWAWDGQAVKGAAFMSKSTRFWRGMAKRSKALRSCRSPPGFGV